ncbi:hypothetical protein OLX02_02460 [Novosphingobium sp. KCTC 2891]|uniref:hypothetical protein n=1 Tax=Novosphingobium sp. KCTC 2891 TaxID=2989730 RepID=UPI002222966C|nr:hypothetical protein [Novosphingobium sp. KCTC 2891]MCW1381678.1 hypothetical protein [Novosphingobium sp. KCTC 2891]
MNGGSRIIPIDGGQSESSAAETVLELEEIAFAPVDADPQPDEDLPAARQPLAPWVCALAVAAWSGFFVWANLGRFSAGITPADGAQLAATWTMPVLLACVLLLLVMRGSRRETARFNDAARLLALESERLETRLVSVNTELSLARDFIAAQSRDLESLGRVAVDRLSGSAGRLQDLIAGNGAQIDRIGEVASHALENMEKLRGQLPVIANAAKDVTNNIANAGRSAHVQIEDLVTGFQRLNEFGLASERQVGQIRDRVDAALARFGEASGQIGQVAKDRFDALEQQVASHRERLDHEEIAALAAIRGRADALARELADQRTAIGEAEDSALAALNARFLALREESEEFARTVDSQEEAALKAWSERTAAQVQSLRQAIEEIGRDHDGLLAAARQRLAAFEDGAGALARRLGEEAGRVDADLSSRRASLESSFADQRDALQRRLAELDKAIGERRAAIAAAGAEAADALASKLAQLDHAVEAQRERQLEDARLLGNHCDAIADRVAAFSATLRASGEQGAETAGTVERAMGTLNGRLAEMREALSGTDLQIGELTESAVRLLELIRAGGDHTRTQIPEALRSTEAGLHKIEDRVFALRDTLREAGDTGRTLSERMSAARGDVGGIAEDLTQLQEAFSTRAAEQEARLGALRDVLAAARRDSDALSQDIDGRLSGAITQLTEAAASAGSALKDGTAGEIEALAERFGEESNAAIMRVLQGRGAELVARLEEAIDTAASSARETALQMRDQLAKVDELAGNLENRVSRARERAEEQVDNDFARRTALITESLNSTAIDIAKVLSADVSETAWASYLRGDRGIFTRRAVSLLENNEAKAVQQLYESDTEFREHVNRFIHDFESMLRQLLSTRDGNALGVTLLSSDMGKLYVALAQGIERLRT